MHAIRVHSEGQVISRFVSKFTRVFRRRRNKQPRNLASIRRNKANKEQRRSFQQEMALIVWGAMAFHDGGCEL